MKVLKLAALAASITVAVAQSYADQTNVVQNLNVQLFGVRQGTTYTNRTWIVTSVDTMRVNTRRVIDALGAATANSFSSTSRLVTVTPLGGGASAIQVRDGNNTVDVSAFFIFATTSGTVEGSLLNMRNGRSSVTDYSIQRFALQDVDGFAPLNLNFDVSGFATENSTDGSQSNTLTIDAAGTGTDRNGSPLIIQGVISVRGRTLEVVPGGGGVVLGV